ncbi:hypothetical protein SQ03_30740 [Methylobacterium platani JCM 14648]|uniref:Uncharacterized protein n=1 Tax=Methylobacterium platani JCM 14648 TaxID=1295136 RepID=A0ABR5GNK7_9HYPH|nr:hypothetical protein SQ03_30740 [Methylobacterium platani JCM 14648]
MFREVAEQGFFDPPALVFRACRHQHVVREEERDAALGEDTRQLVEQPSENEVGRRGALQQATRAAPPCQCAVYPV